MKVQNQLGKLVVIAGVFASSFVNAQTEPQKFSQLHELTIEPSATYQNRNDQAVPGNTGTRFSLSDVSQGPFANARFYYSYFSDESTQWRVLIAPLELRLSGRLSQNTTYQDSVFAANTDTKFFYKFNSYRLTWAKHYKTESDWRWAIGFTGKIRDAEVRLEQGSLKESKTNIGFVPLLNLQARYQKPDSVWGFRADFDGLAAPQGRAFDVLLAATFQLQDNKSGYIGYRTVEGGADNDEVYNFAWLNSAVFGFNWAFGAK